MTEFAIRPIPLTFMPMPAVPMANHRPKRKSGSKTFLDDGLGDSRGDDLPPLKKTRRSSPDENAGRGHEVSGKAQTRTTRSRAPPIATSYIPGERIILTFSAGSAAENEDSTESIFSKGPSRAKKAKRKQKEVEELQKKQEPVEDVKPVPRQEKSPPAKLRRQRATKSPERESHANGLIDERPLPAQTNSRQSTRTGRKPKAYNFETPRLDAPKVRRSPRLKPQQEESEGERMAVDKPLTVPLAAIEDTPLVRKRNKEMREAKGHRRSSLGLRGRRASSLTNGCIGTRDTYFQRNSVFVQSLMQVATAAPHPDVQPKDFFKHLDAEMIETQRMQQLLAWCSKRALSDKRARGRDAQSNARAAARVIEEEILADLTEKKLNVNWWDAAEKTDERQEVPKKPHPRNEDHERKIAALEQQLNELKKEKQAWTDISEQLPIKLPKKQKEGNIKPGGLDRDLLRPEEVSSIPGFEASGKSLTVIQDTMSTCRGSIEFKVDQFSHGMHKAQQFSRHAKGVSEKVLAEASAVLGVRQEAAKKAAGTHELPLHEVLKSISHLDRG
ncbi:hypothetical protein ABW19_dt0204648 [Dactylella cylindrospora]|nr:hypothetical protein ABW19_dt0204648 [Dactylella cylindrospora]